MYLNEVHGWNILMQPVYGYGLVCYIDKPDKYFWSRQCMSGRNLMIPFNIMAALGLFASSPLLKSDK